MTEEEIKAVIQEIHDSVYEQGRKDAIEECKQILLSAMAKDGKTKCHEYMVALNEMEHLKEQK